MVQPWLVRESAKVPPEFGAEAFEKAAAFSFEPPHLQRFEEEEETAGQVERHFAQ